MCLCDEVAISTFIYSPTNLCLVFQELHEMLLLVHEYLNEIGRVGTVRFPDWISVSHYIIITSLLKCVWFTNQRLPCPCLWESSQYKGGSTWKWSHLAECPSGACRTSSCLLQPVYVCVCVCVCVCACVSECVCVCTCMHAWKVSHRLKWQSSDVLQSIITVSLVFQPDPQVPVINKQDHHT